MTKLPGWKIRRELGRLRQQLSAIPEAVWEPRAQARHDRELLERWPVRGGAHPGADKVAAFLIWQPEGIEASVLRTVAHLSDAGYAPFVVSNARVSDSDRAALDRMSWRWMERPNFGYDFGGYRDALRLLRSWKSDPKRLVILNNSMWFPLRDGDETLARMEGSGADIAGSILRRRDDTRFLESYIYSISSEAWRGDAFHAYWDGLRITSNKYKVIRRGERGFSVAIADAGLTLRALFTDEAFRSEVAAMGADDLMQALRFAATMDDALEARRLAILATGASADDCRSLVQDMLVKGQFYSSFPVISAGRLGYPFLKKSREPISELWRQRFVDAVEAGALERPEATVWGEVTALAPQKS